MLINSDWLFCVWDEGEVFNEDEVDAETDEWDDKVGDKDDSVAELVIWALFEELVSVTTLTGTDKRFSTELEALDFFLILSLFSPIVMKSWLMAWSMIVDEEEEVLKRFVPLVKLDEVLVWIDKLEVDAPRAELNEDNEFEPVMSANFANCRFFSNVFCDISRRSILSCKSLTKFFDSFNYLKNKKKLILK